MSHESLVKFIEKTILFHFTEAPEWADRKKFMVAMSKEFLQHLVEQTESEYLEVGTVPELPPQVVIPVASGWLDIGKDSIWNELHDFHETYCAEKKSLMLTQEVLDDLKMLVDDEKEQEKVLEEIKKADFEPQEEPWPQEESEEEDEYLKDEDESDGVSDEESVDEGSGGANDDEDD